MTKSLRDEEIKCPRCGSPITWVRVVHEECELKYVDENGVVEALRSGKISESEEFWCSNIWCGHKWYSADTLIDQITNEQ